jgi:hypothetical protein
MVKYRDYQARIIKEGTDICRESKFVYLAMEVRTGKTLTSLGIADNLTSGEVLFVTKKKAISSIQKDYDLLLPDFTITFINYESMHKLPQKQWSLVILDEAHCMGAFAKPSKRSKQVKLLLASDPYVILLSGTPTPESYSQMYHQVYGIKKNPFVKYKNFYRFCDDYVNVTERKIGAFNIKNYSDGKDTILEAMKPYTISYSQKEAGFESQIEEEILTVRMNPITYTMCRTLKRDKVIDGSEEVILGDTGVKLMSKIHQMCSGTVKFESGKSQVIDLTKAEFIKERFEGKRIGVFYKFKAELTALMEVFGDDLCMDLDSFDSASYPVIALQIVSGREGISLRNADYIVFYNIDFSATSYWQARDRMTTKDRKYNKVFWIFSEGGIEHDIYKAVSKKKNYTLKHFNNDGAADTKEENKSARGRGILRN